MALFRQTTRVGSAFDTLLNKLFTLVERPRCREYECGSVPWLSGLECATHSLGGGYEGVFYRDNIANTGRECQLIIEESLFKSEIQSVTSLQLDVGNVLVAHAVVAQVDKELLGECESGLHVAVTHKVEALWR